MSPYRSDPRNGRSVRALSRSAAAVVSGAVMLSASLAASPAYAATPPVTLNFWTAMSGANGAALDHLVNEFNNSQHAYKVVATYKGSYTTVLSDTIAAFRAHNQPNIAQIFDAGTATIMDANGVYEPIHSLMAEYNLPFSTSDFIGGAASYYETAADQLDSLPFNSSTPVLYYNKKLLAKAGIAGPPSTWDQFYSDAKALTAHGVGCSLTSSGAYVMWTDMEEFDMWNGYEFATQDNGYDSITGVKLMLDTPALVAHWSMLGQLGQKDEYLWNGTTNTTVPLFSGGTCAMYEQSSADLATITAAAKFPFGVAPLPTVNGDRNAPQNTVVGGASLWVLSGEPSGTYQGDAEFLHFLMSGPAQAYWASHTGYVAVSEAGVQVLSSENFYKSHPSDSVATKELTERPAKPYTRGIRLGYLPEIREVEASAISEILSGKETAAHALAAAQAQGDKILSEFASQYGG
ncbi:MAG TPA: extracellular solute-binding protein [Acidimicrobiales bacterium]|nr:extracellular solute-binding protein [Acidimicrobiales bacterium]